METTFYAFMSNIRFFLASLLKDPIKAEVSDYLKKRGMKKTKLINILIKRGVLKRHESIDDKDKDVGVVKYCVTYKVVRKQFERKLKRIYNKYFEGKHTSKKEGDVEECTTCAVAGPVIGKLTKDNIRRNIFVTKEQYNFLKETLTTSSKYTYTAPALDIPEDDESLEREPGKICVEKMK